MPTLWHFVTEVVVFNAAFTENSNFGRDNSKAV